MFMTNWNCDARLWQFEIGGKTLKLMKQSRLLAGDTLQRANTLPRSHVRAEAGTSCPHTPPGKAEREFEHAAVT